MLHLWPSSLRGVQITSSHRHRCSSGRSCRAPRAKADRHQRAPAELPERVWLHHRSSFRPRRASLPRLLLPEGGAPRRNDALPWRHRRRLAEVHRKRDEGYPTKKREASGRPSSTSTATSTAGRSRSAPFSTFHLLASPHPPVRPPSPQVHASMKSRGRKITALLMRWAGDRPWAAVPAGNGRRYECHQH